MKESSSVHLMPKTSVTVEVHKDVSGPYAAWYVHCPEHGHVLFEEGSGYSKKRDAERLANEHLKQKHSGGSVRVFVPPKNF